MIKLINNSIYLQRVSKEIEGIKKHTTKEQKNKLDFLNFHPDSQYRCIYGQMTGDCYSDEAIELIKKIKSPCIYTFRRNSEWGGDRRLTALESYIYLYPNDTEKIMKYIKGKISSFKLTQQEK